MDVESLDTLKAAIAELNTTTVPAIQAALSTSLAQANAALVALSDRTVGELSNTLQGAILGIQAIVDKAMANLNPLLDLATTLNALLPRIDGAAIKLGPEKTT